MIERQSFILLESVSPSIFKNVGVRSQLITRTPKEAPASLKPETGHKNGAVCRGLSILPSGAESLEAYTVQYIGSWNGSIFTICEPAGRGAYRRLTVERQNSNEAVSRWRCEMYADRGARPKTGWRERPRLILS